MLWKKEKKCKRVRREIRLRNVLSCLFHVESLRVYRVLDVVLYSQLKLLDPPGPVPILRQYVHCTAQLPLYFYDPCTSKVPRSILQPAALGKS